MRRIIPFALLGLMALAAQSRAGCPLGGCCPDCKPIPCVPPCDCGCPCENRRSMVLFNDAEESIATLRSVGCTGPAGCASCGDGGGGSNCCERIKAAEKLGSRFHADFCCNPEVLEALVGALQCDPCWEVRKAAAWSIMLQGARTEEGVLALYIASKTDPHYMVRTEAAQALDILTVCCDPCYADLYKRADDLIKQLKAKGYKPGSANCQVVFGAACAGCGLPAGQLVAPPAVPPLPTPPAKPEAAPRPLPAAP